MTLRSLLNSIVQTIEHIILSIYRAIITCIMRFLAICKAVARFFIRTVQVFFKSFVIIVLVMCAVGISSGIFVFLFSKAIGLSESKQFQQFRDDVIQELEENN